ncbi:hypothetical protein RR46_05687 [Papilio xuthus]|uniref:Uncharacterized protein n=1 Tax=Papilio xuthus TaxID=66420 RepID=A0A194Q0Z3_PAPXU|nr:hypothetical protein RR46_05687 [Papilio xuthus]
MNELLQKHGCANVFTIPEGLKELMADIAREVQMHIYCDSLSVDNCNERVLREQPKNIHEFISNYLSVLLITREHGVMAVKILEDLCDCRPSVSQHLIELGLDRTSAETLAQIIKDELETVETSDDKDPLSVINISCYGEPVKCLYQSTSMRGDEPWQLAAERTLALYKKTKPSLHELHRASERIQAAYRGYHVRRNLLKHLKPKKRRSGPQESAPGPTPDIGGSREINLGPLIKIKVREDNVYAMFEDQATATLGLSYHPTKTLTHVEDDFDEGRAVETGKTGTWPICGTMKTEIRMVQVDARSRVFFSFINILWLQLTFHIKSVGLFLIISPLDVSGPEDDIEDTQPLCMEREAMDVFTEQPSDRSYSLDHRALGTPARKISFSTMPPEMIPNDDDDFPEIQEAIQEALDDITNDVLQEIPEDIPNSFDDKDPDYTPVSSVASLTSAELEDQDNVDVKDDTFYVA